MKVGFLRSHGIGLFPDQDTRDHRVAAGVGAGGEGGALKTVHLDLLSLDQPHLGQELADVFTLITLQL